MDFHSIEQQAVLDDAQETQALAKLLQELALLRQKCEQAERKYEQAERKYEEAERRCAEAERKAAALNAQLAQTQAAPPAIDHNPHPHTYSAKDACSPELIPFGQNHASYLQLQHTKRKVISGFVAELACELETSEELLLRERRMHEELRRSLQTSNEEVLALKASNRALEAEVGALLAENRQLLGELGELQGRRDALEVDGVAGCRVRRTQEAEEWALVEQLYRQIEAELAK